MSVLYLFGNGFDRAHGINTSYSDFRHFLEKNHGDFLHRFEAMYNIHPLDDTEPWYTDEAQKRWIERVQKDLWVTFEEEMGKPNIEEMYDYAVSLAEEMPEIGVKDTLDWYWKNEYGFVQELQAYILEWLKKDVDTSFATCKKDSLCHAQSDFIINFNYTDTIKRVYGIKNVLHIHGGLPTCSDIPPIIGHGNKYVIDSNRRKAKQCQDECIEWAESIYDTIANYCEVLYKDTERIIAEHDSFFVSLKGVEEVICLGLSFGDVDIPYLQRIAREVESTTKWIIYYYDEKTHKRLKDVFGILGISRSFEVYFLPSDSFWDR